MHDEAANPVQSLDHACRLLVAIRDLDDPGVTRLAEHLGLAKSTVSNHLATLETHQFVVEEGGTYRLGLRWLTFGGGVRDDHRLYRIAKGAADDLAAETGELTVITTLEYGRSVYLYRANVGDAVTYDSSLGVRLPVHCTAAGKVLLADLGRDRVEEILDYWGLPKETENTITDRETLFEDLARVRRRGYALDDEERIEGMRGVAAPIVDGETDETLGALAVGGPTSHIHGDRFESALPDEVRRHAKAASVNVTYA